MKKSRFIYLGLIVFLISCNKEGSTSSQSYTIPLPQVLKDYGYFLPGTYWVYQDSASHATDSVYVIAASCGNNNVSQSQNLGYTGSFGYLNEKWGGTHESEINNLSVDMNDARSGGPALLWMDKTVGSTLIGKNLLMTDSWTPGYTVYPATESAGCLEFINLYDSLKVLNTSYKKVIQVYDRKNILHQNNRTNIYISKNQGIIRKVLLDSNKVWNLIRSHIVQ